MGHASRGVVVGVSMTRRQLRAMDVQTALCQEFVTTRVSEDDGTNYDLRFYCHDTEIMAPVTRHFEGDKMNLSSAKAGIRRICVVDASLGVGERFMSLPSRDVRAETVQETFLSPAEIREREQQKEADRKATWKSALH